MLNLKFYIRNSRNYHKIMEQLIIDLYKDFGNNLWNQITLILIE